METFDLPPLTSANFIESLQNVRDAYKPPAYASDMSYPKSHGESALSNLTSLYLDNGASPYAQTTDVDVSSHCTNGFPATAANIYTCASLDQRLFQPQGQQQTPSQLVDSAANLLYGGRADGTRHGSDNDKTAGDLCSPFDAGMPFTAAAGNQLAATSQLARPPRFSSEQTPSDGYGFVDHPTYAQNPFVYFQPTPPRIKETTYPSYTSLYPSANRPFSNVLCPDVPDFHYPTPGDVFQSPSSRRLGGPLHQTNNEPKQRQCMSNGDMVDVEGVEDSCRCKNTVEGTKTSVRRFRKWYKDKFAKNLDINRVDRNMANSLLKDFFLEIRDTRPGKEGNEYEPVTLTTYRNGLRRYFLERKVPPAPDNFDLADKEFDIVNYHLITKRNDLKRNGKGNHPNVVESITEEQLDKMWASGAIGTHSPRALLRLQWWLNTIHHGIRGRMAHHDLNIEDFQISRSLDGKLCIEHVKNTAKRKLTGENDNDYSRNKRKCKARMVATDGSERDPVRAFEVYLKHRPPGISSFYLTPKHKPKGEIWFNKVPMGKNSIGRIMREIKAVAGIN